MISRFARRMDTVRSSEIRELLKLTQRGDLISFGGGLPAPELFPVEELLAAAGRVLTREGTVALQYSPTEGFGPLRDQIATRMNRRWGTRLDTEHILITTGSQQGLDLIGKLFLDEGDEVFCESPTYVGAITAWAVFQPSWVEVPTDDEGMVIGALEERLRSARRAKILYVIPNFQNPSGRTWSLDRRRQLVQVAARHGVPIIEDNPYGEVRFEGRHLPSLMSLAGAGDVIDLGTLSKVFCPGLRLGWIAAEPDLLAKLAVLKQGADLHTSTFDQMLTAEYFRQVDLDARIDRLAAVYGGRRNAMIAALEREMPPGVRFTRPAGGLFLWVELPEGLDARILLRRALDRGVAFVSGVGFFPNGGHENTMRLNFSNMPEERIAEGIRRLAGAVRELLEETQGAAGPATVQPAVLARP